MSRLAFLMTVMSLVAVGGCKTEDAEVTDDQGNETTEKIVQSDQWTFLTSGVYHNDATVIVGEKSKSNPNAGHWMDFHDNGSYAYGIYEEQTGEGTWSYDNTNSILQLTPGGNEKQSEWQVKYRHPNLILIGTSTFADNSKQLRYVNREERPAK